MKLIMSTIRCMFGLTLGTFSICRTSSQLVRVSFLSMKTSPFLSRGYVYAIRITSRGDHRFGSDLT